VDPDAWRGSGFLGWLRRRTGRGSEISLSMVEELFGPHRHRSRQTVQEQRQAADQAPAPGDPPASPP
jgi:hypothetical protein